MRRIAVLLMVMASVLLAASGVAWAVTKTCPTAPKNKCYGTSGSDVLKSTSKSNYMIGKGGNDTYTHFVRGNSDNDGIYDSGGKDKLDLSNYSRSELKVEPDDLNNNGKPDSLSLRLGKSWQNTVVIEGFYNDKKSKPPFYRGPGYIEVIRVK